VCLQIISGINISGLLSTIKAPRNTWSSPTIMWSAPPGLLVSNNLKITYSTMPLILSPSKVPSFIETHRRYPYGPVPISIFASKVASRRYKCLNSILGIPFVILNKTIYCVAALDAEVQLKCGVELSRSSKSGLIFWAADRSKRRPNTTLQRTMPKIRTRNTRAPPEGFDEIEPTLLEFAQRLKDGTPSIPIPIYNCILTTSQNDPKRRQEETRSPVAGIPNQPPTVPVHLRPLL